MAYTFMQVHSPKQRHTEASTQDLPVSCHLPYFCIPSTKFAQTCASLPSFWDLKQCPHACTASTFSSEPSPQPKGWDSNTNAASVPTFLRYCCLNVWPQENVIPLIFLVFCPQTAIHIKRFYIKAHMEHICFGEIKA